MSSDLGGSLKIGAVLNWLNFCVYVGTTFLLTPIIISKLGKAGFGTWSLIQSLSGYYGLVNLGMASAMTRFIARDLAKRDQRSLHQTVSTALVFFSITSFVVLVLAALIGRPLGRYFDVPPNQAHAFAGTLFFCAIAVVCEFFGALTTAFLTAKERFDLTNGLSLGRLLVQTAIILILLRYWPSIFSLAGAVASVAVLALLVGLRVTAMVVPDASLSWRHLSYLRFKELLSYGSSTVLMTITNIVRLRVGNVIIAKTSGLAVVGAFSVATNLVQNMNSVMSASLNVLNARFTRLEASGDFAGLQRLYRSALFSSSAMAAWMGLLVYVLGERFLLFWIGPTMLEAVLMLKVLTVGYVLALAQAPSWNLMFALSKHHFMSRVSIVEAAGILALGLWLAKLGGAVGFSYATAGMMVLTKVLVHPPYAARIAGLTLREYLTPITIPLVVAALLLGASRAVHLEVVLRERGIVFFGAVAIGITLIFTVLVLVLSSQKTYLPSFLKRFTPYACIRNVFGRRSAVGLG